VNRQLQIVDAIEWRISPINNVRWFELLLLYGRGMSTWEYAIIYLEKRAYLNYSMFVLAIPSTLKLSEPLSRASPSAPLTLPPYKLLFEAPTYLLLINMAGADGWELNEMPSATRRAEVLGVNQRPSETYDNTCGISIMRREVGQGSSSDFIKS
jgi:hypothetical protein